MIGSRAAALVTAAGAMWWANRAPMPRSADARAVLGAGVAVSAAAVASTVGISPRELGLARADAPAGLRLGAAVAAPLSAGWAVAAAVSALRPGSATGAHDDFARWVLLRIPLGTVVTEELLFRSVLYALTRRAFTLQVARTVCAVTFGLWHLRTARRAGDNVPMVFAATTVAGVGFDWLRTRSGSVVAPALVHYALNAGGALMVSSARK